MKAEFCIDLRDAGLDEPELARWWREGLTPAELIEWIGEKYDLTRRSEWGWS